MILDAAEIAFERTWTHPRGGFHFWADHRRRIHLQSLGVGTVEGAEQSIAAMEAAFERLGPHNDYRVLMDLTDLRDSPIRGQIIVGRWVMRRRHHFAKVSVFGARPWERRLGQAVVTMAGMASRVGFFPDAERALAFLDWG